MKTRLELRNLRPNSVATYLGCARRFIERVGKPPSSVTRRDVEECLLALKREGKAAQTRNVYLASIRFWLCASTRRHVTKDIPRAKVPHTVRTVLSGSEVERLLAAARRPHVHCIVTGGGLALDGSPWLGAAPDFLFPVHCGTSFAIRNPTAEGTRTTGPTARSVAPRAR
jgi:hypothetical protein